MNKKIFIYGGIGISIFLFFIVLLLLLLGRSRDAESGQLNDLNRFPTKAIIDGTNSSDTSGSDLVPPDLDYSGHVDLEEQTNESQLVNAPGTFLYNQLPHEEATFEMIGDFVDGGGGIIEFTVTAKGDLAQARQAAQTWMKSLGLTQNVIDSFDITYQ